ncbi:hypothetical protein [Kitasatospora sp. NPDC004289]
MGYDVHVTRRENWWDAERGSEITAREWRDAVEADPELVMTPASDAWDGDVEIVLGEKPSERWPLWWRDGRLWTKNPAHAVVLKMCQVAELLHARVQGDDGEYYERDPLSRVPRLVPWAGDDLVG